MTILAVIFGITTIICGVEWFTTRAALNASWIYILGKGEKMPTDEEIKELSNMAVRMMLGRKP